MPRETLAERMEEFELHMWNHADDEFQKTFDIAAPLADIELSYLCACINAIDEGADDEALARVLYRILRGDRDRIMRLLQMMGLTRNKILQDLKAITSASDIRLKIPSTPQLLVDREQVWKALAGPYLAKRLRLALESLAAYDDKEGALRAMNQVTWPGYIRQERAKRQGHQAEGLLATLLFELDLQFAPEEKVTNPLCRDVQIAGVSFDIVAPDPVQPVLVVKSTVQTANIGQFGESKSHLEVGEAQRLLAEQFEEPPSLVAVIDGVGFRSNVAGLKGVLSTADEFAQFRTLWKVAVMAAAGAQERLTVALPPAHAEFHRGFIERWGHAMSVTELNQSFRSQTGEADLVQAGEALLRRDT